MTLTAISSIHSNNHLKNIIYQYINFTFPDSLNVQANTINSETYIYNDGSGNTASLNGNYCIMATYASYPTQQAHYNMFSLDPLNNYATMKSLNIGHSYIYNSVSDTSVFDIAFNNTFGPKMYNPTSGNYEGNISTTYNTSLTSSGEFVQLKFPFGFVFQKLTLTVPNVQHTPKAMRVLGSNDNISWTQVAFVNLSTNYTINVPTIVIDISSTNTTNTFKHNRFVWETTFSNTHDSEGIVQITNMKVDGLGYVAT